VTILPAATSEMVRYYLLYGSIDVEGSTSNVPGVNSYHNRDRLQK